MAKQILVICAVIALILAMTALALADVPQLISFQGKLFDNAGNPLTGQLEVTFRIYDAESDGTELWSETDSVTCENGLYHVILGQDSPINLDFDGSYWLGVRVTGDPEELSPRYRLVGVPYAFRAIYADSAGGFGPHDHAGETLTGNGTGTGLTFEDFSIGLRLSVTDTAIIAYSPTGPAIVAISGELTGSQSLSRSGPDLPRLLVNDEKGPGSLHGVGTAINPGVSGESDEGIGVYGQSDEGNGVYGQSDEGDGVSGYSTNGNGGYFYSANNYGLVAYGGTGKAAKFEGDVDVDGEIYAKSLHTTTKKKPGAGKISEDEPLQEIVTSAIDSLGNASFNSVEAGPASFSSVEAGPAIFGTIQIADFLYPFGLYVPRDGNGTNRYNYIGVSFIDTNGVLIGSWNSTTGNFFTVGDYTVNGTKNAVVQTDSYEQRKLYTEEAAEVYFFDRGQGQLLNGEVTIRLDPMFLETVTINKGHPMLVQVTLTVECNGVFISGQTERSFTVKELMAGRSNATFNWEVAAKRKGYEDERLEPFTMEVELIE